jgi:hypothetical protein
MLLNKAVGRRGRWALKKQTVRITNEFASLSSYNIHTGMPLPGTSVGHANPHFEELFNKGKLLCN